MRQLRSILYDKELQHRMEEQAKVEAGKKKIEWGSQIRSYVFDDRRVKIIVPTTRLQMSMESWTERSTVSSRPI